MVSDYSCVDILPDPFDLLVLGELRSGTGPALSRPSLERNYVATEPSRDPQKKQIARHLSDHGKAPLVA